MFNTTLLNNAGLSATTNPTLRKLFAEVVEYNSLPSVGSTNPVAVRLLDKIMKHAAVYLTSKRPGTSPKNMLRWNAMTALANQAAGEASTRGVKLLSGPADFKTITGAHAGHSYWLERVDPQHRPGFVLSAAYETWVNAPRDAAKRSFWDHIANQGLAGAVTMVKGTDPDGVDYLECYRIRHNGNVFVDSLDEPFDTTELSTAASGNGWAIFVLGTDGRMYARAHEVGFFHHSSFLAGKPVAAAGELVVDQGVIKAVTAKTGHYKASVVEMRRLMNNVPQIPGNALILPDYAMMLDPPVGQKRALWYRCDHFAAEGTAAPFRVRAEVRAHIPYWAELKGMVRIPATNP